MQEFATHGHPYGQTGWIEDDDPMVGVNVGEDGPHDSDIGEVTSESESVIPAISACIINMIFSIMTWLDLDSLGQNNHQAIGPFYQSIASFHGPSNCYFLTNQLPSIQAIATFQASDFQSQV